MGISIELYRIRIGSFETYKPLKIKCNIFVRRKYNTITIFIFSIIIIQLCNGCLRPQSNFIKTGNLVSSEYREIGQKVFTLYSWSQSGPSINKIQKIINGNRRSIGYKLAVWNCGRGL